MWIAPEQYQPDSKWITMAIWSKTRVTSDLACNKFPEEKRQSLASARNVLGRSRNRHALTARIHLKDLINGCVTTPVAHASGRRSPEQHWGFVAICLSRHTFITHAGVFNILVDICRKTSVLNAFPWCYHHPLMENKAVCHHRDTINTGTARIPQAALPRNSETSLTM